MYNISKYIVSQIINENEVLLYSTLSTSVVVLEKNIYTDIFKLNLFDKYDSECRELADMGFLFMGDMNAQLLELEKIRKEIVDAEHGITAITIAPTMDCNARCFYCFEKGAQKGTMSFETADKVTEFLIRYCVEKELYISWFGGEPLMAANIITYINSRLIEAGIKVESTITTNGILIDKYMIDCFKKWNVTRIQITVDGLEETYNRIKNYKTSLKNPFGHIIKNIEMLINFDFNVHLRVNYKSDDYETALKTLQFLHERFGYYDKLYLYGVPLDLPSIKGYSEFDSNEGHNFLKILKYSLNNGYENDELNFRALKVSPDYNVALGELMLAPFPAPCFMVNKYRFVIDDAGYLYKCQKHLGKQEYNCGSVYTGISRNDIYYQYVTSDLFDIHCSECFMLPICQGGCNANRILYGNKFACPPSKTIIKQLVLEYYKYLVNIE